ncbi:hypothetical protein Fuma_03420 [Fuerstiella marisgermanici]|uniref:Uncharacterized protein n=2 Tax=Fuerstiella marisgermanici TaxID=1891926 RepID=A0A1P8WIC2_9PLAN|nr:hypothetical protein Fuma_03420 [Fuerstiella marisgermanici]
MLPDASVFCRLAVSLRFDFFPVYPGFMPVQYDDDLLTIVDTSRFVCPGETSPVSSAVHLGRLASGWPGCAECRWRNETAAPRPAIRRTEYGVRGAYLNAIDRFKAGQLAAILSTHLTNLHSAVDQRRTEVADNAKPASADEATPVVRSPPATTIAVGFDGSRGTPDLFAGVVSAVRQNGCPVLDAGQTSAAALLNVCRQHRRAFGAIMVTGAGAAPSETGLDVFLADGQTTAIPWQDFGVGIRFMSNSDEESDVATFSGAVQQTLNRIRSGTRQESDSTEQQAARPQELTHISSHARRVFRSHRISGTSTAVDTESLYRSWLLRWWPRECRLPVEFATDSDATLERLRWITKRLSLNLTIRRTGEVADGIVQPLLTIDDDDRFLTVRSPRGRVLSAVELADWMNHSVRTTASHVTAHARPGDDTVVLVDVAAPNSGRQQDVITDGLATAGFLMKLLSDDNRLPA